MVHFTIVRHGETVFNATLRVQSRTGGELTERGASMATALGEHLQNETFTRIFSSDLNRCRQTTKFVTEQLQTKVPEVVFTPDLRERDYGDWEFLPQDLVREKRLAMNLPLYLGHRVEVPNGETYEDCKKRAGRFFSEILKIVDNSEEEGRKENILAVSHGTFIQCLLDFIIVDHPAIFEVQNLDPEQLKQRIYNTSRTRLDISPVTAGSCEKRQIKFTHVYDPEHLINANIIENNKE